MKEDSNSNTNSKIQLTQKFQSNNEINQNNKNQEFLGQNLKNILLTYNKINNPQKENISVPVIMNNKIKCHKSFHKGNEKNYSLNNETKPPLKFGIQANFKNLLKKIEPKSKLA